MKWTRKPGWQPFVVLFIVSACRALWTAGHPRNARARALVTNMMDKKKTVCVRRFLIDMTSWPESDLTGARTSVALPGTSCLQFDNTMCMSDEVMFDIHGLDDREAFRRQSIPSSRRSPIAKLLSTLP